MDYLDEIEADFVSIYHIFDYEDEPGLGGAKFIRLINQLPLYDGAVRRRIEIDWESGGSGESRTYNVSSEDSEFQPGQSMSMNEAIARSQGDETAVLHALNEEHANSQFGALFDYETG